jgi:hypothetical protein
MIVSDAMLGGFGPRVRGVERSSAFVLHLDPNDV